MVKVIPTKKQLTKLIMVTWMKKHPKEFKKLVGGVIKEVEQEEKGAKFKKLYTPTERLVLRRKRRLGL